MSSAGEGTLIEHRAAFREGWWTRKPKGLRKLNLSRDQILARLWELANLSHQVRGSIAGQIKALSRGRYGKCYWDWRPSHQAFAGVASPAQ
jgi:hypothetical protein